MASKVFSLLQASTAKALAFTLAISYPSLVQADISSITGNVKLTGPSTKSSLAIAAFGELAIADTSGAIEVRAMEQDEGAYIYRPTRLGLWSVPGTSQGLNDIVASSVIYDSSTHPPSPIQNSLVRFDSTISPTNIPQLQPMAPIELPPFGPEENRAILTVDLTGDGVEELVMPALTGGGEKIKILKDNLSGGIQTLTLDADFGLDVTHVRDIAAIDFDEDGDKDLIAIVRFIHGGSLGSKFVNYENRGNFSFASPEVLSVEDGLEYLKVQGADIDRDGKDELVSIITASDLAQFSVFIVVQFIDGRDTVLQLIEQADALNSPTSAELKLGNFDGDSDADFAAVIRHDFDNGYSVDNPRWNQDTLYIIENKAVNFQLTVRQNFNLGNGRDNEELKGLDVGDIDGNGYLDLVTIDQHALKILYLRRVGDFQFSSDPSFNYVSLGSTSSIDDLLIFNRYALREVDVAFTATDGTGFASDKTDRDGRYALQVTRNKEYIMSGQGAQLKYLPLVPNPFQPTVPNAVINFVGQSLDPISEVRNFSFEDDLGYDFYPAYAGDDYRTSNGEADGWQAINIAFVSTRYKHSGSYSLSTSSLFTDGMPFSSSASQDIPVEPNKSYRLEGYLLNECAEGYCTGSISVQCLDASHQPLESCSGNVTGVNSGARLSWNKLVLKPKTSNPATRFLRVACHSKPICHHEIGGNCYGGGEVYCDDITLFPTSTGGTYGGSTKTLPYSHD